MAFEWDPKKRATNRAKHGIDFVAAARIFEGPTLEQVDDREDYGEERILCLGVVGDLVLQVAYTWRGRNRRLISARRATRNEAQAYIENIGRRSEENEGPD